MGDKRAIFLVKNRIIFGCMFAILTCLPCQSQSRQDKAEFPGGTSKMYVFISKNFKYPEKAISANVSGKIVVSFTVKMDGSLDNFRLIQEPGFGMAQELVRVVKMMPKWNPAKKSGKAVESEYLLPLFVDPE